MGMGTPAEVLQGFWLELRGRTRVTIERLEAQASQRPESCMSRAVPDRAGRSGARGPTTASNYTTSRASTLFLPA